jgi:hypothetical protein
LAELPPSSGKINPLLREIASLLLCCNPEHRYPHRRTQTDEVAAKWQMRISTLRSKPYGANNGFKEEVPYSSGTRAFKNTTGRSSPSNYSAGHSDIDEMMRRLTMSEEDEKNQRERKEQEQKKHNEEQKEREKQERDTCEQEKRKEEQKEREAQNERLRQVAQKRREEQARQKAKQAAKEKQEWEESWTRFTTCWASFKGTCSPPRLPSSSPPTDNSWHRDEANGCHKGVHPLARTVW